MKQKVTREELIARQSLPLDVKVELSKEAIRRWYEHWHGEVTVSFSGGMDSTVLLHLVRSVYPDVQAVCVDALLYPEIREHVKATENVLIVRPELKWSFTRVVEHYGYPVVSKRTAQYVSEVQRSRGETATKRLRLTGIKSNGTFSPRSMISHCWQFLCDAPFQVSHKCCNVLKKKPLDGGHADRFPFVGTRVAEADQREVTYYTYGCNGYDMKHPRSTPIAFWLDNDIWDYVREFNVPYSRIYDMGYTRTGCFACMFGIPYEEEPNRFQRMQVTHPQLWRACEKWGIPEVLDYIGVSYAPPEQPRLFEYAASGRVLITA